MSLGTPPDACPASPNRWREAVHASASDFVSSNMRDWIETITSNREFESLGVSFRSWLSGVWHAATDGQSGVPAVIEELAGNAVAQIRIRVRGELPKHDEEFREFLAHHLRSIDETVTRTEYANLGVRSASEYLAGRSAATLLETLKRDDLWAADIEKGLLFEPSTWQAGLEDVGLKDFVNAGPATFVRSRPVGRLLLAAPVSFKSALLTRLAAYLDSQPGRRVLVVAGKHVSKKVPGLASLLGSLDPACHLVLIDDAHLMLDGLDVALRSISCPWIGFARTNYRATLERVAEKAGLGREVVQRARFIERGATEIACKLCQACLRGAAPPAGELASLFREEFGGDLAYFKYALRVNEKRVPTSEDARTGASRDLLELDEVGIDGDIVRLASLAWQYEIPLPAVFVERLFAERDIDASFQRLRNHWVTLVSKQGKAGSIQPVRHARVARIIAACVWEDDDATRRLLDRVAGYLDSLGKEPKGEGDANLSASQLASLGSYENLVAICHDAQRSAANQPGKSASRSVG